MESSEDSQDLAFRTSTANTNDVICYTDGCCLQSEDNVGGWASSVLVNGNKIYNWSGSELDTDSNRMELTAVIEVLKHVEKSKSITIYTDSEYVRRGLTLWAKRWADTGWKRIIDGSRPKNDDLWRVALKLVTGRKIDIIHVNAHETSCGNNRMDAEAKNRARALKRQVDGLEEDLAQMFPRVNAKLEHRIHKKNGLVKGIIIGKIFKHRDMDLPVNFSKWLSEGEKTKNIVTMEKLLATSDTRAYRALARNPNLPEYLAEMICSCTVIESIYSLLQNAKIYSPSLYVGLIELHGDDPEIIKRAKRRIKKAQKRGVKKEVFTY